jgi:hypothetical protein
MCSIGPAQPRWRALTATAGEYRPMRLRMLAGSPGDAILTIMAGNRNSGRHRKPAAIRKAEGNRSHRPIPAEPQGRGQPVLPLHLSADERAIFSHVIDNAPAGLITAADQHVLEAYAVAVALFRDADKALI